MRLSLFSDYSLRVLVFGAAKAAPFPLHEVADAYHISRHHLVKVVNNLTKQGYLATRRGRGGGIELAMKPEDIQLGRLLRRTESPTPLVECFDPQTNTCPIHSCCGLKGALAQAMGAFYSTLDRYTLRDLLADRRVDVLKSILLSPKTEEQRAAPMPYLNGSSNGAAQPHVALVELTPALPG